MPCSMLPNIPVLRTLPRLSLHACVFKLFNLWSTLPIHLLVFIDQPTAQNHAEHRDQQAKCSRDPHSLPVEWLLACREHICPQQRTALSHCRQNRISTCPFTFRRMDVRHPRQKQSHRRENLHRQEDAEVPRASGVCRRVDDEPDACQSGCQGAEGPTHLEFVRQPAEENDCEEAEDIWRSREALGLDASLSKT